MIRELVELGERLRTSSTLKHAHDALKIESIGIDCIIRPSGEFVSFQVFDKVSSMAEGLSSKKGQARLLLDKCEEVLNIVGKPGGKEGPEKKYQHFIEKLKQYGHILAIKPVILFYEDNKLGVDAARKAFFEQVPEKKRVENIAFRVEGQGNRIHEDNAVYDAIVTFYENVSSKKSGEKICSICQSKKYPVDDIPHGMIKRVPSGQSSGCALVSFNSPAFESYGLIGNQNSSICTHCAKAYVEALNWLMTNCIEIPNGKKGKPTFIYTNQRRINSDTAFVFWLRDGNSTDFLDLIDSPTEDGVRNLLASPFSGVQPSHVRENSFYGIVLSGAAARVMVRDWIEMSISDIKHSLQLWFQDVGIVRRDSTYESECIYYPGIPALIHACKREAENNDQLAGRIGAVLWRCSLRDAPLPLWILSSILNRIRVEHGKVTPARASLIKLFLKRNILKNGGYHYMEKLDERNVETPYLCGRLFAVLERLQYHAMGEVNAGIGERFFTSASSTPATAFGRLLKLSKQHLSKLKGDKPGLAVNLDKEMQQICSNIVEFPAILRLEEQGCFALGYYHQKSFRNEKDINNDTGGNND